MRSSSALWILSGGALGILLSWLIYSQLLAETPIAPVIPASVVLSPSPSIPQPEPIETAPPLSPSSTLIDGQIEHVVTTTELHTPQAPPTAPVSNTIRSTTNTQYVVLAFDGSRSISMWQETRAFAKQMIAEGKPLHFTYFINTAYLVAPKNKNVYHPPEHATGTSAIGFADSEKDVANRLEQMNAALTEGHELGCHLTGHYNGSTWTAADWKQEFNSFFDIVTNVGTINHLEKEPLTRRTLELPADGIVGFRAPELGVNKDLWPVLKEHHFQYDTSLTAKPGIWPTKLASGLWELPLTRIAFAGSSTSSLLSMDYNFYFKQSHALETATRGTPLWDQYYAEVMRSYRDYFKQSYTGNHAPIFIGHHFSLWNDGVYWEAMKTFASEVCGLPDVRCVSYKEVMQQLDLPKS